MRCYINARKHAHARAHTSQTHTHTRAEAFILLLQGYSSAVSLPFLSLFHFPPTQVRPGEECTCVCVLCECMSVIVCLSAVTLASCIHYLCILQPILSDFQPSHYMHCIYTQFSSHLCVCVCVRACVCSFQNTMKIFKVFKSFSPLPGSAGKQCTDRTSSVCHWDCLCACVCIHTPMSACLKLGRRECACACWRAHACGSLSKHSPSRREVEQSSRYATVSYCCAVFPLCTPSSRSRPVPLASPACLIRGPSRNSSQHSDLRCVNR